MNQALIKDDTRESPSLTIIDILMKKGAQVQYSDPYIPVDPITRKYAFNLTSIDLIAKNIQSFDMVLLATDHDDFDYDLLEKEAKLILDTRGKYSKSEKVVKS